MRTGPYTLLDERLRQVEDKLDRVIRAVGGDKDYGNEGLAQKVEKHQDWIQRQKLKEAKIIGIGTALGVLWTLFLQFWKRTL
jgi:hypothetical protein